MAIATISPNEIEPGAPVTSSLFVRLRNNILFNNQLIAEREAGDITNFTGSKTASDDVTLSLTSGYNGEYRISGTVSGGSLVLKRNGATLYSGPNFANVDYSGWSIGDLIELQGVDPTNTVTVTLTIKSNLPGALVEV